MAAQAPPTSSMDTGQEWGCLFVWDSGLRQGAPCPLGSLRTSPLSTSPFLQAGVATSPHHTFSSFRGPWQPPLRQPGYDMTHCLLSLAS